MKYMLLFALLVSGIFASAQEKPVSSVPRPETTVFNFDSLSFSKESSLRTMVGNVRYKSPEFSFEKADRVEMDPATGKMWVYGCKRFQFSGKLVMEEGEGAAILSYTPGDQELYLKRK